MDWRTAVDDGQGLGQRGLDFRIAQLLQTGHECWRCGDRGQTPLDIATMLLEMTPHQTFQHGAVLHRERTTVHEELGQPAGLVPGPTLKGIQQVGLVDQTDLKRQDAEEQVRVQVGSVPSRVYPPCWKCCRMVSVFRQAVIVSTAA